MPLEKSRLEARLACKGHIIACHQKLKSEMQQLSLSLDGPTVYPDQNYQSYKTALWTKFTLVIGAGYFEGVLLTVDFFSRFEPFNRGSTNKDLPIDQGVTQFLSLDLAGIKIPNAKPDGDLPSSTASPTGA